MATFDELKQPKTKKGKKTMERLIKAGEKCFCELTYPAASITDIAKEAKIGVGTFYIYFDSKHALLKYLVLSYYHDIRKSLAVASKNCKTREEVERVGFQTFFEYILANPYCYSILWQTLVIDRSLFDFYYGNFAEKYKLGLAKAIEDGEVKNDIDPDIAAFVLMGITNFVGLKLTVLGDASKATKEDIKHAVDESMKILNNGLYKKA